MAWSAMTEANHTTTTKSTQAIELYNSWDRLNLYFIGKLRCNEILCIVADLCKSKVNRKLFRS